MRLLVRAGRTGGSAPACGALLVLAVGPPRSGRLRRLEQVRRRHSRPGAPPRCWPPSARQPGRDRGGRVQLSSTKSKVNAKADRPGDGAVRRAGRRRPVGHRSSSSSCRPAPAVLRFRVSSALRAARRAASAGQGGSGGQGYGGGQATAAARASSAAGRPGRPGRVPRQDGAGYGDGREHRHQRRGHGDGHASPSCPRASRPAYTGIAQIQVKVLASNVLIIPTAAIKGSGSSATVQLARRTARRPRRAWSWARRRQTRPRSPRD